MEGWREISASRRTFIGRIIDGEREGGEWGCMLIACKSSEWGKAIWVKDTQHQGERKEKEKCAGRDRKEGKRCSSGLIIYSKFLKNNKQQKCGVKQKEGKRKRKPLHSGFTRQWFTCAVPLRNQLITPHHHTAWHSLGKGGLFLALSSY